MICSSVKAGGLAQRNLDDQCCVHTLQGSKRSGPAADGMSGMLGMLSVLFRS